MLSPAEQKRYFYLAQIAVGVLFVAGFYFRRPRAGDSLFRVREEDLKKDKDPESRGFSLEKSHDKKAPNFQGMPHEVLGVSMDAGEPEIQDAYRALMKKYHPDRVARPGSAQWNEAQKNATAINAAKDQMLKKGPTRSGR